MKTKLALFVVIAALLSGTALMLAGCETWSNDDRGIAITPAAVQLTNDFNWVVTFHAGEEQTGTNSVATTNTSLFFPLKWSVSDPSLGAILSSEGSSAIYQSYAHRVGVNVVYCRDQSERVGSAAVALTSPPPTNAPAP
jgi:hypothetical protein